MVWILVIAIAVLFGAAVVYHLVSAERPADEEGSLEGGQVDAPQPPGVFEPWVRSLAAAVGYGALLGIVVGGVGSRIAMRIVFLTTGDHVRGLESDDGFIIGRFELGDTLGLIVLGGIVGVLGGAVYLLIRRWLPLNPPRRRAISAAGAGVVVGSMIVHPDGVDFTLLGPLWVTVGLFVLIPAAFGWLVSVLVDSADHPESWFRRKRLLVAALPLVLLAFPAFAFVLAIPLALTALGRWMAGRNPRLLRLWESREIAWAGRVASVLIAGAAAYAFVNDIRLLV